MIQYTVKEGIMNKYSSATMQWLAVDISHLKYFNNSYLFFYSLVKAKRWYFTHYVLTYVKNKTRFRILYSINMRQNMIIIVLLYLAFTSI